MEDSDVLLNEIVSIGELKALISADFDDAAGQELIELAIRGKVPDDDRVEEWLKARTDLVSVKCCEFLMTEKEKNNGSNASNP